MQAHLMIICISSMKFPYYIKYSLKCLYIKIENTDKNKREKKTINKSKNHSNTNKEKEENNIFY